MTLQDFEAEIRNAVNHVCYPDAPPADIRPFVCSGRNPLVRKVFIVGENAATPMPGTDFWKDFWDNAGSKYPDWQQAYDKVRRNEADDQVRQEIDTTVPQEVSKSKMRERIAEIVDTVKRYSCQDCNVLETNLYIIAGKNVPRKFQKAAVLEALFRCICPMEIIAHGAPAYRWIPNQRSQSPLARRNQWRRHSLTSFE